VYIHEKKLFIMNICEGFVNEQRLIIRNAEEMLLAVSRTGEILNGDPLAMNAFFRDLMMTYPNYAVLLAADSRGIVIASGVGKTGYSVADRDYFKRAVTNGLFTPGEFIVSKSTQIPVLPFALPVKNRKGETTVLIATFAIDNYYRELSLSRLRDSCYLEIFDTNGIRLFSSLDTGKDEFGKGVSPELFSYALGSPDTAARPAVVNSILYLVSSGKISYNGNTLYVTVRMPYHDVQAEARKPSRNMLSVMIAAVLLAFSLSLALARVMLINRIERLTDHTKLLAEGKLDVCSEKTSLRDEITDLSESFNAMATVLEERNRTNQRTIVEKEHLLNELKQRISDNLQLLSSMVNLQIEHATDETIRHALMTTHSRIMAMALVYETIYRYSDIHLVDMQLFCNGLYDFLVSLYADVGANISCVVSGDDVSLPVNKALPIALILNEVVSNSLQHAFPAGAAGRIQIAFRTDVVEGIKMEITDNGSGFEIDSSHNDTLGFEMIEALASQVRGTLKIRSDSDGTSVRVIFPAI
jgi:two-component sensor histidine kinase